MPHSRLDRGADRGIRLTEAVMLSHSVPGRWMPFLTRRERQAVEDQRVVAGVA